MASSSRGTARSDQSLLDFDGPVIDLSNCPNVLDDTLWSELALRLHHNERLTHLNLSNNVINIDMAETLGTLLTVNPHIRVLTLANCSLTDAGATLIVRCARKFKSIQSLNLSRNLHIADAFLAELEKLLQLSSCLAELVLMDTSISFGAMVNVVQAMVANTSLLYCTLPFHLGHAILDEVDKIMHRNWKLQQHVDRAAQTYDAVQDLASRERRLRDTKWKIPEVPTSSGPNASHRLRTVEATRSDWTDPSAKAQLLFLTLLDKKAKFHDDSNKEREAQNRSLRDAAISPRNSPRRTSTYRDRSSSTSSLTSPRAAKGSAPQFLQLPRLR
jgi:hypothetical protein